MIVRVSPGKAAGVFHDLMFKCASENRYPGHRERGISRYIARSRDVGLIFIEYGK